MEFPKTIKFSQTFQQDAEFKLNCRSSLGTPDYIYIQIRNKWTDHDSPYRMGDGGCTINNLVLECDMQPVKSINELDSQMLYSLTRRNSHPYADHRSNFQKFGGILLTREDCLNFPMFLGEERVDPFNLDITISDIENPTDFGGDDYNLVMEVFFLFQNYSLKGDANRMRYWQELI